MASDETKQHAMTCGAVAFVAIAILAFAWLLVRSEIAESEADRAQYEAIRAVIEVAESR